MTRTLSVFFAGLLFMAGVQTASAHAFLDHAEPPVGGSVGTPPSEIRLWFNEEVEPGLSTIQVLKPDGSPVQAGAPHLDPSGPGILAVSVPRLAPGTYRVVWRVVATDTHVTDGDFTFTVEP